MPSASVALVLVWGPLADDWAGLVDTGAAARGPGRDQAPVWGAAAVCGNVSPGTEPVPPPPPPLLRPQHELAAWTELFQNLSVSNRNFSCLCKCASVHLRASAGVADLVLVP